MKRIFIALTSLLLVNSAFAETTSYFVEQGKRIDVSVAENGLNRILISNDRIVKIVGDGELYSLEGESKHGFIFLKSKIPAPHTIPITILTEKNKVLDVNVHVETLQEPRTVVLKCKKQVNVKNTVKQTPKIDYGSIIKEAVKNIRDNKVQQFTIVSFSDFPEEGIRFITQFSNKYIKVTKIEFSGQRFRNLNLKQGNVLATASYENVILVVEKL